MPRAITLGSRLGFSSETWEKHLKSWDSSQCPKGVSSRWPLYNRLVLRWRYHSPVSPESQVSPWRSQPKHRIQSCNRRIRHHFLRDLIKRLHFADDGVVRKSTQAYLIVLFRGPIAWKSSKPTTVTNSATEAELLALSQALT